MTTRVLPTTEFCWCWVGTAMLVGRREGYPLPHIEVGPSVLPLSDDQWERAMPQTSDEAEKALRSERQNTANSAQSTEGDAK